MERACESLHFMIVSANSLLDLEAVIVDGALSTTALEAIVSDLQHRLQTDVPPDFFVPLIRRGELGDAAAATGAGLLPLHASFSPILQPWQKHLQLKCSPPFLRLPFFS
jgi:predicted NBD/HSP70 family sugar kinase